MERLYDLLASNESWLVERVLSYVHRNGYATVICALEETWRASISDLSSSLKGSRTDPATAFGVLEERRHRDLGMDLRFSLVVLRYFRRLLFDLVRGGGFSREEETSLRRWVEGFFNRVEESFLQERERAMIDEKNLYRSFFERLEGPAFLLDEDGRVINLNRSAAVLLGEDTVFGGTSYFERWWGKPIPLFVDELARFKASGVASRAFEKAVDTPKGKRYYHTEMRLMRDAAGRIQGTAVLLADHTKIREAEDTLQVVLEEMEARVAERAAEAARDFAYRRGALPSTNPGKPTGTPSGSS